MTSEELPSPGAVPAGQSSEQHEPPPAGQSSEQHEPPPAGQPSDLREPPSAGQPSDRREPPPAGHGGDPQDHGERLNLTDPKAIRALAHPLRWTLLEALAQAGTLTATQASEMLGESPANCAFHLRTLAKYGFVEEAGGGRGRERPWRRAYDSMSWRTRPDDPQVSQAAEALDQVWLDTSLARARRSLTSKARWPKDLADALGGSTSRLYLTSEEAEELYAEIETTFLRLFGPDHYRERRDPKKRPADAIPIEFVLLGYPVLDLPPLPADDEADESATADGTAAPN